jgi:MFS superfamily sulfate permease-like transporter
MVIASHSFLQIIACLFVTAFAGLVLSVGAAMAWGIFLADRFTPYLEMSVVEQQKVLSAYDLAQWQEILGPYGITITAVMTGLYVAILLSGFIILKHQCYLTVQNHEPPAPLAPVGEYDEKGRWYKY